MSANLNDVLNKFQSDVGLVHDFVKGDATVTVVGSDGSYPSLAKLAADCLLRANTFTSNSQVLLNQLITDANAEIAGIITAAQANILTNDNAISAAISNGQLAINSMEAASVALINTITTNAATEVANDKLAIDALVNTGQAAIDALLVSANNEIATLIINTQNSLAVDSSSDESLLNNLVINAQTNIDQLIANGQAQITALLNSNSNAISTIEALDLTNINNLVSQAQNAITSNEVALAASQAAIANVLGSAHGVIAAIYKFSGASLSWDVVHNMGTVMFSTTIKNTGGDTVYENNINIVSKNEIVINFTEAESGSVYVTFYL